MLIIGINGHVGDENTGPWAFDLSVHASAEVHTTVDLLGPDSTIMYTIFDGVLDRDCLLTFVIQPHFWSVNRMVDSAIILPFPEMKAGLYFVQVKTPDTTYAQKIVNLGH